MNKWVMCIVALVLGMLVFHMLSNVCGCKVVEGGLVNFLEDKFGGGPEKPKFQALTLSQCSQKIRPWNTTNVNCQQDTTTKKIKFQQIDKNQQKTGNWLDEVIPTDCSTYPNKNKCGADTNCMWNEVYKRCECYDQNIQQLNGSKRCYRCEYPKDTSTCPVDP
jgi:hypothetical protein